MIKRFLTWVYNNSYMVVCALAILAFVWVVTFGCIPNMDTPTPAREGSVYETGPVSRADIKLVNLTNSLYTVEINISESWVEVRVLDPGQYKFISLEKRKYDVCISKGFEIEQKCVVKNVTEDAEWTIKKR